MAMTHAERQKRYIQRKKGLIPPPGEKMTALDRNRKYLYGITRDEFNELLKKQDGKCTICGVDLDINKLRTNCLDHDHTTGKIRAILCPRCNILVGFVENTPLAVQRAFEYVASNKN